MRIGYLDLVGGLSGDMFLAALLDVGLPEEALREVLALLPGGISLRTWEEKVFGWRARRVEVKARDPGRLPSTRKELLSLVEKLALPGEIKERVSFFLEELFRAEAKGHGLSPDEIHLHELSAYDTLADLVGAVWGIQQLNLEGLYASPIPLARGLMPGAHGILPLPAPATLELLSGLPVEGFPEKGETVTPTGALILKGLVDNFGPLPSMILVQVGVGAGSKRWKTRPNVVRLFLGKTEKEGLRWEEIWELVTDLDDETPEILAGVSEKLRASGALDVSFSPLYMKKGRPGVRLNVLTQPENAAQMVELLFRETGTLGVRIREGRRLVRPRKTVMVETPLGPVQVKVSEEPELIFKPEWEDLKRLSAKSGKSLNETKRLVWEALFRYFRRPPDRPE